ncbi:MAG: TIGR03984 family CRISPR-associated protein [Anaerolineales bacterium]|nr:TIGR03984 family CRISPR-associated protein [Anaerolineales bacterium]
MIRKACSPQKMPASLPLPTQSVTDWLVAQPASLNWLLAHTEGGIVWGKRDDNRWHFSSGIVSNSPSLTVDRLLQLRLFGETGEIYLWREADGLHGRQLMEEAGSPEQDCLEEEQILWGTKGKAEKGFTILHDGEQGMSHAVPLECPGEAFILEPAKGGQPAKYRRPVRLKVRHYIEKDPDTGIARLTLSRLVDLCWTPKGA